VVQALSCGVPLVVLPLGADQPDNARRVEALAVGVALDAVSASPEEIAGAVREVTGDGSYFSNATALAAQTVALPDAQWALARVLALASR
jgi:UDP:flavonoid glycosyltransferase YjiC (YdhE family)